LETYVLYIIKAFILPPGINILVGLLGVFMLRRYWKTGRILILLSLFSLYLLSTGFVSMKLAKMVETIPALPPELPADSDRQAIIILGGGRYVSMPEYGKPVPYATVLERLRYAAHIQKQTHLPILISGGRVFPTERSEAWIMNQALIDDFGIEAKWLEESSKNTAQNAANSFEILKKENIDRIYLVTHARHMKRATEIFEHTGFNVIPAPTIYLSAGTNKLPFMQWIPNSRSLDLSRNMLHEMIGHWWYRFRYR